MAEQQIPVLNPVYELNKAYLFLRTAHAAVSSLDTQKQATQACILYANVNGDYNYHMQLEDELEQQETDLEIWQERLIDAQVGLVDWVARRELKRGLPLEMLFLLREKIDACGSAPKPAMLGPKFKERVAVRGEHYGRQAPLSARAQ
ncbi:MAG: hypothetical protein Q9163_006014 [Psora crenata]